MCEKKEPKIKTVVEIDIKGMALRLTLEEVIELSNQLSELARSATPHYVAIGGNACQVNWRNNPTFSGSWITCGT